MEKILESSPRWRRPSGNGLPYGYFIKAVGVLWVVILLVLGFLAQSPSRNGKYYDMPADGSIESGSEANAVVTPSKTQQSKAIIASSWGKKDANWVHQLLPDWQSYIYITDKIRKNVNTSLTTNIGHESAYYLTYIVDHYEELPEYMVFIHGPRYQWHNEDPMFDAYPGIANLSFDYVDKEGYVPLRCHKRPGCDGKDKKKPKPGKKDNFWDWDGMLGDTWKAFFPDKPVPKTLESPCCAQFAVSREAVKAIPHKEWKRWRKYIWSYDGLGEDLKAGMVMEMLWHVMFGKPPVWCDMTPAECYCKTFGLCNLQCGPKKCKGRVWDMPGHVPVGWPAKKFQGKNGLPVDRWWEHLDNKWDFIPMNQRPKPQPIPHVAGRPTGDQTSQAGKIEAPKAGGQTVHDQSNEAPNAQVQRPAAANTKGQNLSSNGPHLEPDVIEDQDGVSDIPDPNPAPQRPKITKPRPQNVNGPQAGRPQAQYQPQEAENDGPAPLNAPPAKARSKNG